MDPAVGPVAALVGLATLVGLVVRWAMTRADKDAERVAKEAADDGARLAVYDANTLSRLTKLEQEVGELREAFRRENRAKHQALNKAAAYLGTLRVVRILVDKLTPDVLAPTLAELLDDVGTDELNELAAVSTAAAS